MNDTRRPTLAELRARVHKQRHREIGNWLARNVARPTAVYGTWIAVRLGLSANQITGLTIAISLASATAIATGSRASFIAGVCLALLAFWLDRVDGQVARWNRSESLDGVYFDYMMHHVSNMALGYALGHGLATRSANPLWSAAGFAIALGWAGLSLHNDCRYKAFFQRLKREGKSYRIDAGSGGRPAPPAPWPRTGLGMLSWPAYKLCEPHAVLLLLTALAIISLASPRIWLICWQSTVWFYATLAPLLFLARSTRAIRRGSVEREFQRWFRPDHNL